MSHPHINADMVKILIALMFGGAIGLEREMSDKAAGLRTNIMICVGAALFTIFNIKLFELRDAHIVAQIVSGIGFLGAGAIMREGDQVTGLTTAATIWTVAAIGMGVGFGFFRLSAWATMLVLFVQLAFTQIDILVDDWRMRRIFRIVSKLDQGSLHEIEDIFRQARARVLRRKLMKKNNLYYSEWYTSAGRGAQELVAKKLLECPGVLDLTY